MFPDFQSLLTRFGSKLLLRRGWNLFLSTSKENRGGIELANQQRLRKKVFNTRGKPLRRLLTFCRNAER